MASEENKCIESSNSNNNEKTDQENILAINASQADVGLEKINCQMVNSQRCELEEMNEQLNVTMTASQSNTSLNDNGQNDCEISKHNKSLDNQNSYPTIQHDTTCINDSYNPCVYFSQSSSQPMTMYVPFSGNVQNPCIDPECKLCFGSFPFPTPQNPSSIAHNLNEQLSYQCLSNKSCAPNDCCRHQNHSATNPCSPSSKLDINLPNNICIPNKKVEIIETATTDCLVVKYNCNCDDCGNKSQYKVIDLSSHVTSNSTDFRKINPESRLSHLTDPVMNNLCMNCANMMKNDHPFFKGNALNEDFFLAKRYLQKSSSEDSPTRIYRADQILPNEESTFGDPTARFSAEKPKISLSISDRSSPTCNSDRSSLKKITSPRSATGVSDNITLSIKTIDVNGKINENQRRSSPQSSQRDRFSNKRSSQQIIECEKLTEPNVYTDHFSDYNMDYVSRNSDSQIIKQSHPWENSQQVVVPNESVDDVIERPTSKVNVKCCRYIPPPCGFCTTCGNININSFPNPCTNQSGPTNQCNCCSNAFRQNPCNFFNCYSCSDNPLQSDTAKLILQNKFDTEGEKTHADCCKEKLSNLLLSDKMNDLCESIMGSCVPNDKLIDSHYLHNVANTCCNIHNINSSCFGAQNIENSNGINICDDSRSSHDNSNPQNFQLLKLNFEETKDFPNKSAKQKNDDPEPSSPKEKIFDHQLNVLHLLENRKPLNRAVNKKSIAKNENSTVKSSKQKLKFSKGDKNMTKTIVNDQHQQKKQFSETFPTKPNKTSRVFYESKSHETLGQPIPSCSTFPSDENKTPTSKSGRAETISKDNGQGIDKPYFEKISCNLSTESHLQLHTQSSHSIEELIIDSDYSINTESKTDFCSPTSLEKEI